MFGACAIMSSSQSVIASQFVCVCVCKAEPLFSHLVLPPVDYYL